MNETHWPLLRVRDWDGLYENNRSREIKRADWFPASNDLSADAYIELIENEQGAAHFGAWNAILMVVSRARPRCGLLVKKDGQPHTAESLARVTRIPEALFLEAIPRLLQIGLLEIADADSSKMNSLAPHPAAGISQDNAGKPQKGAAEGKGTEHHHQEGNRKEKKRTERAGDERTPEGSSGGRSTDFFQRRPDDEPKPAEVYASPEDELKAIYLAKAGEPITVAVLDAIRVNLEVNSVTMGEFVSGLGGHLTGNWKNPAGFLRDLAKKFHARNQPASEPVTAAEAAEQNYRCEFCASRVRGEGAIPTPDGKARPCKCASAEYVARQQARGVFAEEQSQ